MADLVQQNEQEMITYKEQLKAKDNRIKTLEQQLRTLQNSEPPAATKHETAAKVDRNDLTEIHQRYAAVLSTMNEKCTLNNAYRLAGTAQLENSWRSSLL